MVGCCRVDSRCKSKPAGLQKLAELLDGQTGPSYYCAHGYRFDWIAARDMHSHDSIAHRDVLALLGNLKARFFESANGPQVIDTRNDGHI